MTPPTCGRTSATRCAVTRPGNSVVNVTELIWTVLTPTSGRHHRRGFSFASNEAAKGQHCHRNNISQRNQFSFF